MRPRSSSRLVWRSLAALYIRSVLRRYTPNHFYTNRFCHNSQRNVDTAMHMWHTCWLLQYKAFHIYKLSAVKRLCAHTNLAYYLFFILWLVVLVSCCVVYSPYCNVLSLLALLSMTTGHHNLQMPSSNVKVTFRSILQDAFQSMEIWGHKIIFSRFWVFALF